MALLERSATLALTTAQDSQAARLLGASHVLRHELGAPIMPYLRPILDLCLEHLRARMTPTAFNSAFEEGRKMSSHAANRAALAVCKHAAEAAHSAPERHHEVVIATPSRTPSA
jgi:hypothetical protein